MRNPIDEFISVRNDIIEALSLLQTIANDHFDEHPDDISDKHVDRILFVHFLLRLALAIARVRI